MATPGANSLRSRATSCWCGRACGTTTARRAARGTGSRFGRISFRDPAGCRGWTGRRWRQASCVSRSAGTRRRTGSSGASAMSSGSTPARAASARRWRSTHSRRSCYGPTSPTRAGRPPASTAASAARSTSSASSSPSRSTSPASQRIAGSRPRALRIFFAPRPAKPRSATSNCSV